jgi:hypothetical protein
VTSVPADVAGATTVAPSTAPVDGVADEQADDPVASASAAGDADDADRSASPVGGASSGDEVAAPAGSGGGDGGSTPWGVLAAGLLVAALGGGAAWRSRARTRNA